MLYCPKCARGCKNGIFINPSIIGCVCGFRGSPSQFYHEKDKAHLAMIAENSKNPSSEVLLAENKILKDRVEQLEKENALYKKQLGIYR